MYTDDQQQVQRRTVLGTIAAGAALGAATIPASARSDDLARELNTVRAATRQYRDVSLARADGYTVVSPYTPGMGFHFVNPGVFAADETGPFSLEQPQILVYFTTEDYEVSPGETHDPERDDDLRLGAVEFAHVGDEGAPGTPADLFSDEEASRRLRTSEEAGWEWVPGADITALHAWVHRGNPGGVFHPANPTID